MAIKIRREITFGVGNKGYRFENHEDEIEDTKQYQNGRDLEEARFIQGSLAQRIFDRLSPKKKRAA
jgi:hypothetical protein